MRLFLAIDLPDSLKRECASFAKTELKGAKWASPETLHLTLRFIGEFEESQCQAICKSLRTLRCPSFPLSPQGLGCFPSETRPRILWLGLQAPPPLFALQSEIEAIVRGLGLAPEEKAFSPHITLARFRFSRLDQVTAFLEKHRAWKSQGFEVKNFILYSSILRREGAEHRALEIYPLS